MSRQSVARQWRRLPHPVRWVGAAVVGATLIAVGAVLLVLPGPGLLLIALGVAVLATEFAWAETLLRRMRVGGEAAIATVQRARRRRSSTAERG